MIAEARASRTGGALIIDDVPFIRKLLLQHLRRVGWRPVIEAAGGREALACLKGNRFDLILLDVALPERRWHRPLACHQAAAAQSTAYWWSPRRLPSRGAQSQGRGAYSVLVKPVDSEYLGSLLRELREGRKDG